MLYIISFIIGIVIGIVIHAKGTEIKEAIIFMINGYMLKMHMRRNVRNRVR